MIKDLQEFLKDPAKLTRAAMICFFLAVLFSGYFLFTLPHSLVYDGGMIDSGRATGVYVKLFIVIGLAFAFCYAVILYTQKTKKETIVYLDKSAENANNQRGTSESQSLNSLDIKSLREKIGKAKGKEEKWQQGLNQLCSQLNAGQGALYSIHKKGEQKSLDMESSFAVVLAEGEKNPSFNFGEGLIGQVAASGKSLYLDELPEGFSARIESGLGSALPKYLFVLPIKKENEVSGVIEIATFTPLTEALRQQAQEAVNVLSEIS
jgi:hypothetical protein